MANGVLWHLEKSLCRASSVWYLSNKTAYAVDIPVLASSSSFAC